MSSHLDSLSLALRRAAVRCAGSMGTHEANLRVATAALVRVGEEQARLIEARNQAIRQAHLAGMSFSTIAEIVGLHRSRVGQIVKCDAHG